jgi:hypothetical protein
METDFYKSRLGRFWARFWGGVWILILIIIPLDLILRSQLHGVIGLVVMSFGLLSLLRAKWRLLRGKVYYSFGREKLNNVEKNYYSLGYCLLYFGFVLSFYI